MQTLQPLEYKEIIRKQGRNISWVCRQLECSYSLVNQFFRGDRKLTEPRLKKLHEVLGIED